MSMMRQVIYLLKNKKLVCVVIAILVLLFIVLSYFVVSSIAFYTTTTKFTITPNMCQILFNCTPDEFSEQHDYVRFVCENFCEHYKVADSGDLLVWLNDNQIDKWSHRYEWDLGDGAEYFYGVVTTEDYKNVTVTAYRDDSFSNILEGKDAVRGCIIQQLVRGVKSNDVEVTFTVLDAGNQKCHFQAHWPDDYSLDWLEEYNAYEFTPEP